jgi:hypothetical protein
MPSGNAGSKAATVRQIPRQRSRWDMGTIVVLGATIVLLVSLVLPWYTLWLTNYGIYKHVSLSALDGSRWRFDLPAVAAATAASVLMLRRLPALTLWLSIATLLLTLFWWFSKNIGVAITCPAHYTCAAARASYDWLRQ